MIEKYKMAVGDVGGTSPTRLNTLVIIIKTNIDKIYKDKIII